MASSSSSTGAAVKRLHARRRSQGFSLIEALVTIVVLSIGVLALAILQLQTMVDTRTATMRNIAAVMAYNLGDQMRSNETAKANGTYHLPAEAPQASCYTTAGCSPDDMARTGYAAWLEDLRAALPGAEGVVCVDSTPADGTGAASPACDAYSTTAPYVIKIWWREDSSQPKQLFATTLVP